MAKANNEWMFDPFGYLTEAAKKCAKAVAKWTGGLNAPLSKVIAWWATVVNGRCPVCGQVCKVEIRRLSPHLAAGLVVLRAYRRDNPRLKWFHYEHLMRVFSKAPGPARGELAALRHWGLLRVGSISGGPRGHYRITLKGKAFVRGLIRVPCAQRRVKGQPVELIGEMISLEEAMAGSRYSAEEILKADYSGAEGEE